MRRLCALLAALTLGACGAGDGLPGAPHQLTDLHPNVPAAAAERGLFFNMGSVLRLDGSLGFVPDQVDAVLESGAPPFTVLSGDFEPGEIERAAARWGYEERAVDGQRLLVRSGALAGDAPPLVSAVPALALHGGVLLLGTPEELVAGGNGDPPEWLSRAVRALGPEITQAALAPAVRIDEHAERLGAEPAVLLSRHGAHAPLRPYEGYAIGRGADGRGVVVLVQAGGRGGPEQAAALAARLATTSVLGEPGRRLADAFDADGPRWLDEAAVVRLPVRWTDFDAARLRADVEGRLLVALVPEAG